MLTIRLQRTGKRNQADFRIVLAEKAAPVNKKIVEILGSYNPRKKLFRIRSEERLKQLFAQNTAVSPTVHNLFVTHKVLEGGKVKSFTIPKKPEKSDVSEKSDKPEAAVAETPTENQPAPEAKEEAKPAELDKSE
jgi:small subunit ribosomal protein S16